MNTVSSASITGMVVSLILSGDSTESTRNLYDTLITKTGL